MNKVILMGRLTKDPVVSQSGNTTIARYTLAANRQSKDDSADFISCVGFNKTAEFIKKYLQKGMQMLIIGSIRTGSYKNKEGQTIYTTDVVVNEHYFCGTKEVKEQPQVAQGTQDVMDGFESADDGLSFLNP